MMKWMDATYRPAGEPDVSVEPDGTVEVTWALGTDPTSALTLLMEPDAFTRMIDRGKELQMLGKVPSTTDAR
jgi:hypothetical protein